MEEKVSQSNLPGFIQPVDGLTDNYLIHDQFGNAHEMVELLPFNWDAAKGFKSDIIHPAFVVDGKIRRLFIGKYQASNLSNQVTTKKNGLVAHSINYEGANAVCNMLNDGSSITGFHLITNAEWAALVIMSHEIMKGVRVQGNNKYGRDFSSDTILGLPEPGCEDNFKNYNSPARWLAGSGGVKTSHNGNESGVYDLNGNVWEWVKGLRLNNGEINIIPDAAIPGKDISLNSPEWKAILEDGKLVDPGTKKTLKFNGQGKISNSTALNWSGRLFKETVCAKNVDPACPGVELLKKLSVFPHATDLHGDYYWYDTNGENLPVRGGGWYYASHAGLFNLYLDDYRGVRVSVVGFRVAFVL